MHNGRRMVSFTRVLSVFFLVSVSVFLGGCAKQAEKVHRVGIISGADTFMDIVEGFKGRMRALGYAEGKNIIYDLEKVNADLQGEKAAAEKLVRDKVDLIFAFPCRTALAAKAATRGTGISVVFALSGLEGVDLVESLHRPGENITGVRYPGPEINVKRLEFLCDLAPQAKRIYIAYDRNYPTTPATLGQLRPAAASLGVVLIEDQVTGLAELQAVLDKRSQAAEIGIDAVMVMPDILNNSAEGFAAIAKFARAHKLPMSGCVDFTVEQGAAFTLVPEDRDIGQLAANLADKIFKGTPPGTIMVVTPYSRLRLNQRVIKELGLTTPEGLLNRADEIIR
jgi:putative tryptophan/tyrosine transport system substrate-binding protein